MLGADAVVFPLDPELESKATVLLNVTISSQVRQLIKLLTSPIALILARPIPCQLLAEEFVRGVRVEHLDDEGVLATSVLTETAELQAIHPYRNVRIQAIPIAFRVEQKLKEVAFDRDWV